MEQESRHQPLQHLYYWQAQFSKALVHAQDFQYEEKILSSQSSR